MTLTQVASQLYNLSVGGYFNGEKFTKSQFTDAVKHWMRGINPTHIIQIALPDGWWFASINRYGNRPDEYDYTLPDTREGSDRLQKELYS